MGEGELSEHSIGKYCLKFNTLLDLYYYEGKLVLCLDIFMSRSSLCHICVGYLKSYCNFKKLKVGGACIRAHITNAVTAEWEAPPWRCLDAGERLMIQGARHSLSLISSIPKVVYAPFPYRFSASPDHNNENIE